MTGVLFAFDGVTVVRGDARILDDLTVVIPDQGITAIVGPSGAGKSTMLRCCNRLDVPDDGRITFRGVDLASLDPLAHRRRVAMVFQAPVVFAGTCLDNLRAADRHIDLGEAEALMDRVGLPAAMLDRVADTLSGGEAQRLCLARALATRPEVVLADEITASLDADASAVIEHLLSALAGEGVPIVWVSHDLEQVRRSAGYVIALAGGRLDHGGPPQAPPAVEDGSEPR
jgi:putative ABC transport system ATP-binding protein